MALLPTNFQNLTSSWFSKILNVPIKSETFKVIPNVQEGLGFLSMMVRVEFEVNVPVTANDTKSRRKYNLIVKLLPDQDALLPEAREAVLSGKFDQVEINVYRFLLPDLIQEVPEIGRHVCQLHFGGIQEADLATHTPYTSVLVLEDLRPLDYTTKLFTEKMTPAEIAQGIEFLASFHVAVKKLEYRKGAILPEMYHWFPNWLNDMDALRNGPLPAMFSDFSDGFESTCKFLDSQNKPEISQLLKAVGVKANEIMRAVLIASQAHPCGAHMDLWSHNILVNSDPGKPVQVIDWQLLSYTDPMLDLAVFISTLPVEEMNRSGICRVLRSYFNKYSELCAQKNLELDRSYVEFEEFLLTFGMGFCLLFLVVGAPIVLSIPDVETKLLSTFQVFADLRVPQFLLSIS